MYVPKYLKRVVKLPGFLKRLTDFITYSLFKNEKILVIDDDEDILEVVRIALRFYHFDVKALTTGKNVAGIVQEYQPDLILLDIILPGKSGIEICKELKSLNSARPLILFSAVAKKGKDLSACNADGFIHKPFDILNFVNTIKSYLK